MKIGIPRGLYYHDYKDLWYEFFTELGMELIISPPTNKEIMNMGLVSTVDGSCLPVKVFHGHVEYLKDKVDYIYLPRMISICPKEYNCPKFLGLTDMVRASVKNLPQIIDFEINLYTGRNGLKRHFMEVCRFFNKPLNIVNKLNFELKSRNNIDTKAKIMLLGHNYNIYDPILNQSIPDFIRNLGLDIIIVDDIDQDEAFKKADSLPKKLFWTFGRKLLGSALIGLEREDVLGIIYYCSFGCGPDSMIAELIERFCKRQGKPYCMLTFDEHTSEVGMHTRVEAFIDMLIWRCKGESYIC